MKNAQKVGILVQGGVASPGQRKMESDSESCSTFASERSFEAEDFSPSESPEAGSVVEDHGGPEPSLFEPLAPAPAVPEAGAPQTHNQGRRRGEGVAILPFM